MCVSHVAPRARSAVGTGGDAYVCTRTTYIATRSYQRAGDGDALVMATHWHFDLDTLVLSGAALFLLVLCVLAHNMHFQYTRTIALSALISWDVSARRPAACGHRSTRSCCFASMRTRISDCYAPQSY